MNTETLDVDVSEQPELVQENGKRKRVIIMSDKQLKALEEGRKKRWLSKQQVKEEQPTSTSEEEAESTETHTSESEESKTDADTETETPSEAEASTVDESGETLTYSDPSYKSTLTESLEEAEETDSDDTKPPSPPVL